MKPFFPNKIFFAGLLISLGMAHFAHASELNSVSWQLTADRLSRFEDPPSVLAEGNVVMSSKNVPGSEGRQNISKISTIKGDWILFDNLNQLVKIKGHALVESEDEQVTADSAELDLKNHTGSLKNVTLYFPKKNLYLGGKEVEKTGDLSYTLVDGWVTRCDPEEGKAPPWSFGWTKGKLTYGGFAHFTHATLRVKDVPVIYSPYFAFSTNVDRKTGLLLPEWSQGSRDGAGLLVPLFLNLSPSHDMTLYAGGLTKRGVISGAEFRYVHDYTSKGTLAVNYLNDRLDDNVFQDYKSDGVYRTEENRYWIRGKADHDFGMMLGRLDLDLVSDHDYLQEFDDGLMGFSSTEQKYKKTFSRGFDSETTLVRSNTAQLYKAWDDMSLNGEVRVVNDPSSVRSTQHLWTLPRITFSGQKSLLAREDNAQGLQGVVQNTDLAWDAEYVYLWMENGVGSQRLDVHPKLKVPVRLSPYLETRASFGVRETLYSVEDNSGVKLGFENGIISRTLYDFDISASTIFMKTFDLAGPESKGLTHMVRPSLSYTYVPPKNQENLPDLEPVDRIAAVNSITYGVSNDFDLTGAKGMGEDDRKLAYLKVSQSYDMREKRRDLTGIDRRKPFTDLVIDAAVSPYPNWALAYKTNWNMYGEGMTGYQAASDYSNGRGDGVNLEYRFETAQDINQLNFRMAYNLTDRLLIQGLYNQSLDSDKISDASLRIHYNPACWSIDMLATTTSDDDYRFTLQVNLEGIGKVFGINQVMNYGQ